MKDLTCGALLFDLDGVLIDSTNCIIRHWATWAGQHGLDVSDVMKVAHGLRTIETMRLVAPHLDIEAEAERHAAREIADTDGIVAIEGALQLLESLPGDAWAVVTSGGAELATARLRRAGLPVPGILVTADDVLHGKPAPDPYLLGAERLGVAVPQCVVVEDAPAGLQSARAAGMRAIGVASTHSREELHRATVIVERLSAISVSTQDGTGPRLVIQVG